MQEHVQNVFELFTKGDKKQMKELNKFMQSDLIKTALARFEIRPLGILIRDVILLKNQLAIQMNAEGMITFFKEKFAEQHFQDPEYLKFIRGTYVSVSITDIVKDFAIEKPGNEILNVALLTPEENELLMQARSKKLQSLKVKYDDKGKMKILELTDKKKLSNAKEIASILLEYPYAEIEVKTEGRKIQVLERTRKIKL